MDQPVILLVDDDVASLAIVDREVRRRYGADYRVIAKQSPQDAFDELQRLHDGGEPIVLVLADQWMPGMPGAEDVDTEELRTVPAEALFVMIGATPHTDWLPEGIARDDAGYILIGSDLLAQGNGELRGAERAPYGLETSLRGVFAVGDVRHGSVKRVASAAGEGAMAVRYCHECLERFRMKEAA